MVEAGNLVWGGDRASSSTRAQGMGGEICKGKGIVEGLEIFHSAGVCI